MDHIDRHKHPVSLLSIVKDKLIKLIFQAVEHIIIDVALKEVKIFIEAFTLAKARIQAMSSILEMVVSKDVETFKKVVVIDVYVVVHEQDELLFARDSGRKVDFIGFQKGLSLCFVSHVHIKVI